jgi:poly-gamma-glutamate capsule biosynthesis protein CapA/YwtB (metallophosphatase superfamily)
VLPPDSGLRHGRLPPRMTSVFTDRGFNVVSVASNHAMDWSAEALLDTIELLLGKGIQTIGGGRKSCRSAAGAIIECNGLRTALPTYCSILHERYAAGLDKWGWRRCGLA